MKTFPLLLAVAALAAAPGVRAATPAPLSDEALSRHRGGLATPFGFDLGFGATVTTYVDGALALETRLTWTDGGAVVETGAATAPGGISTAYLPGALGGGTEVRHELSAERIASLVINTASGRTLRQQTEIVLVVPQLADLQARALANRTWEGVHQALASALTDAAR